MRAITFDSYGTAAGLRLSDIDEPAPAEGELAVRVAAAGLNAYDWHQYTGRPWIMRPNEGWRVRETRVLGADLVGTVIALGEGTEGFAVGDRVIGEIGRGALGEIAVAPADKFAPVPANVPDAAAAAVPMAGLTALQALRDTGELAPGERVLVWGASGGVGHLGVQLARVLGASRVDAVCSGANTVMVSSIGADHVYDYTRNEAPEGPYDVVLDTVATAPAKQLKQILAPGGRVVTVGAVTDDRVLGPGRGMARRMLQAKTAGVDSRGMIAKVRADDLALLGAWLAEGSLKPFIAQTYPLADAPQACARLEDGHVGGKLIVSVGQ